MLTHFVSDNEQAVGEGRKIRGTCHESEPSTLVDPCQIMSIALASPAVRAPAATNAVAL
jgi:hypothetical protein